MNRHGLTTSMACGVCNRHLHDCECPDLNDRMRTLTNGQYVISRWCKGCDSHFTRCECKRPDWWYRTEGELTTPIIDVPTLFLSDKPVQA